MWVSPVRYLTKHLVVTNNIIFCYIIVLLIKIWKTQWHIQKTKRYQIEWFFSSYRPYFSHRLFASFNNHRCYYWKASEQQVLFNFILLFTLSLIVNNMQHYPIVPHQSTITQCPPIKSPPTSNTMRTYCSKFSERDRVILPSKTKSEITPWDTGQVN